MTKKYEGKYAFKTMRSYSMDMVKKHIASIESRGGRVSKLTYDYEGSEPTKVYYIHYRPGRTTASTTRRYNQNARHQRSK